MGRSQKSARGTVGYFYSEALVAWEWKKPWSLDLDMTQLVLRHGAALRSVKQKAEYVSMTE
jgi:hypothetical protein